jgi:hypothetical protein
MLKPLIPEQVPNQGAKPTPIRADVDTDPGCGAAYCQRKPFMIRTVPGFWRQFRELEFTPASQESRGKYHLNLDSRHEKEYYQG